MTTDARESIEALLRVKGVGKRFGHIEALRGVDLAVPTGGIYGLLGPNGAGKSTLMNVLSGIVAPDSGTVEVSGEAISHYASGQRRKLGLVPQKIALYPTLSPLQNLATFGALYDMSRARIRERSELLLQAVGLWDRRKDRVKDFSGGMQRRLNIAASLMHEPTILLCDEPTVGVDPQSRNAIFDFLEAQRDLGLTVIYTTHYMEEAERLCDRIAIIDHGRIIAEGSRRELLLQVEGSAEVRLRRSGASDSMVAQTEKRYGWKREKDDWAGQIPTEIPLSQFYVETESAGIPVRDVSLRQPSLEALFLQLTGRDLRE
jgi:ABC-2 type transport system ATP-binding protein